MNSCSDDAFSGNLANWEDLGDQTVTDNETKMSEECDHPLDEWSCSLSLCSLCDSQDTKDNPNSKPAGTITSGGESGTKETMEDKPPCSSKIVSLDLVGYRRFCATAVYTTSRQKLKHLQSIALKVKDPEVVSFWKNYEKSIDWLSNHYSDPVISGFLNKLAISESHAANYLDGLEVGLVWKNIVWVEESVDTGHGKIIGNGETSSRTAKEVPQVDFQVVMELKADGWYKCEWGVVEVQANKVTFLKFNSPDLPPSDFFLEMNISLAYYFLNRDLELLDEYGENYPNWWKDIAGYLSDVLKKCPVKQFQWTSCNVFSRIGKWEAEVLKADGILSLSGTVEIAFDSFDDFKLATSLHIQSISTFIISQVYLKYPHARTALIYIYTAIYRGLLASWHSSKVNNKPREIRLKCRLDHFSENQCFDKTLGLLPICFKKPAEILGVNVNYDVDIYLAGASEEATRRCRSRKWNKISYPKRNYIEVVETVIDKVDKGQITNFELLVGLTS